MSNKPFKISYVLMCDDARTEDNGKGIFIGVYSGTMRLPAGASAFVGPLVFVVNGELPLGSSVHVKTWIEGPDGNRMGETDFGRVEVPPTGPLAPVQIIWKLFPWNSGGVGQFKVHLAQDGNDSVVFKFEIEKAN